MIKGFSQYINEQYANPQETIDLKYGNPQRYQKESMDQGSDVFNAAKNSDLWDKWTSKVPPPQNSEEIIKEMQALQLTCDSLTKEDKEFCKDAEDDMLGVYEKFLKLNGIDQIKKEDLKEITKRLDPVTYSLKYHFNYPRPYQLAFANGINLYPAQPTDACSPSYPSGHSIDSFVIGGLLSKKFPQLKKDIQSLAERISNSRIQGGIHFLIDARFGREIADDILSLDILSL